MQVDPNIVNAAPANIIIQAAAITSFSKSIVDVIRKTPMTTPPWTLPVFAWGVGILLAFLLHISSGGSLTLQSSATSFMVGLLGGTGAIAVTELQKSAEGSK